MIRALLLAFLALPAWSAPCTPNSITPCTPSAIQKQEIMEAIAAGRDLETAMREAHERVRNAPDAETKYKAMQDALGYEQAMKDAFNKAIQMTAQHYHLAPDAKSALIASPKNDPAGRGEWVQGLKTEWEPEFLYDDKAYFVVKGSDNKNHYIGGPINLKETGGGTYPNGRIVIMQLMFEEAVQAGNPGPLAYIIHHETHHFKELVGRGWDNFNEGEIRAYKASLADADIFELSETFQNTIRFTIIPGHSNALKKRRVSLFPSPEAEQKNEVEFDKLEQERAYFKQQLNILKSLAAAERRKREDRKAAREDERLRQGEMSRCWGEMRDFAAQVCSGSSLDTERYVLARECYRTNEAAPWKVLEPPPTPYPGGCQGDLLDEFERHPNADAGGLMSVIMSFQSRASKKASGCQDTMRRIAKAACAAQGGLTAAELDSFYAAADCKNANRIGPTPAEQVIESCAGRLERALNRRRYSPVEADQLARSIWRSFQPPEEEKAAPPPRQSIDPDPPQGRGGGRGGLCEDYLGRGNTQCPK